MEETQFIPHSVMGLYDKMTDEKFRGVISRDREKNQLIWQLPNGIMVKISPSKLYPEWYVATFFLDQDREIPLTHWHPAEEDVYRDLYDIHTGHTFWVVKKSFFGKGIFFGRKVPLMMEKGQWQGYSKKKRNRYVVL